MKNPFELFAEVEKETGITKVQLQGRQRDAAYVRARVLYSVMARKEGYTYKQIAAALCKDRSTIIHHIKNLTAIPAIHSLCTSQMSSPNVQLTGEEKNG